MSLVEIILTISGMVTFLVGGFILYITKNVQKKLLSILFFGLTSCLSLWIFTNSFFRIVDDTTALIFVFTSYAFGIGALTCALLLSEVIAGVSERIIKNMILSGIAIGVLSSIPGVLALGMTNDRKIISSNIAVAFLVILISFCAVSIRQTIQALKLSSSQSSSARSDLKFMVSGFVAAIAVGVICNLAIPLLFNTYNFTQFGPLGSLVFVAVSAYIILKDNFLDLRYIVIRSTIYAILTITILAIVSLLTTYSIDLIISYQKERVFIIWAISLIVIIVGLSAYPFKRFIDKISNKVFFQQGYSVHKTLNKISSYTAKNIDLEKIQKNTLKVLNETISPQYGLFVLGSKRDDLKVSHSIDIDHAQESSLKRALEKHMRIGSAKIIVDSNINKDQALRDIFYTFDIGTITKLSRYGNNIGYLILGKKKNGHRYNGHDLQLLELISNDLALAIENAQRYEEIQAFNKTLQYKINEATKALKRTNAKLIALDDAKDEFISMASHQLRTPLTSVKGYISMILEEDLGKINDSQRQALKEAFDSSQRMVFLISDFLNVSRIRTGKFLIESKPTDLSQIVSEEILQLRDMAGLKGQEIVYKAPKKFPIVSLDENKTRQVMMNMLDNAIFYTPRDGKITIVLEQTKDEVRYTVTDNGIGVPEKEQHRLFTKFFRAENARKARPDGTGLGLFMAQKIITAQGGSIIFKSKEGEGSTFGFNIPLTKSNSPVIDK